MGHCCLGMKKGQFRHVIAEESRLARTWPPLRLQKPPVHPIDSPPQFQTRWTISDQDGPVRSWERGSNGRGKEDRCALSSSGRARVPSILSAGGVIPWAFKAGVWSRETCRSEGPYERQTISNLFVHPCKTALAFHPPAPISAGRDFPQTSITVTYAVWSWGFSLT